MMKTKQPLLAIHNLHVVSGGKTILEGVSLTIYPGEIHALIGSNGSGKSTLGAVLAGQPDYEVVEGSITFQGEDLLAMSIEERAAKGLFLAFQQPIAIPGVQNMLFMQTAVNSVREERKLARLSSKEWLQQIKKEVAAVDLPFSFLGRSLNDGFSGGEKKRNELLQMRLLDPQLAILDETDSGLDAKSVQLLIKTISKMKKPTKGFLIITHYLALLEALQPDVVHLIEKGKIPMQGDLTLAQKVLREGYMTSSQQKTDTTSITSLP